MYTLNDDRPVHVLVRGDGEVPSVDLLKCFKKVYLDKDVSSETGKMGHCGMTFPEKIQEI